MIFIKLQNKRGNALLALIFLIVLAGAGYYYYNNPEFQRAHRYEIYKFKLQLRDIKDRAQKIKNDLREKAAEWEKNHPAQKAAANDDAKPETRTFEQLLYDQKILGQEIPPEMVRHQPDEITVCFFNADFLLNNPLNDGESVHLANILRFCDLTAIAGLKNQKFLPKITALLKNLRYTQNGETSAKPDGKKRIFAFLYRNDRISALKPGHISSSTPDLPLQAYTGFFKAGNFDFSVALFDSPAAGLDLKSLDPLKNFYATVEGENKPVKDIMIFGDFTFPPDGMNWDQDSLLPLFAQATTSRKTHGDLTGNFWFKKNDLVEFNGKSGLIDINVGQFPSCKNHPVSTEKPVWAQFKLMSDDD